MKRVYWQVDSALMSQAWSQVRSQVCIQADEEVYIRVHRQVRSQMWDRVVSEIRYEAGRNNPAHMNYDDASARLSNRVYEACAILEELEGAQLIRGNGHHMRQEISQFATRLLKDRWVGNQQQKEQTTNEE